jgi:hypothetical protein
MLPKRTWQGANYLYYGRRDYPGALVELEIARRALPMPTAEERAEMRALDAKLDAFAAMLKR